MSDQEDIQKNVPIEPAISLIDIWEKFVEFKRPQCSENTMLTVYGLFTKYLNRLPTRDLRQAVDIRDFALKTFPLESCQRFIEHLAACCEWAIESEMITDNPFKGMSAKIKPPKSQKKSEDDDIDPFTVAERDTILGALKDDRFCSKHSASRHSYYAPFVEFLFLTGCRPSEAIALQWGHISSDCSSIQFEQSVIYTGKTRKIRQGLKTQERRRFPCNTKLQQLLQDIKQNNFQPETLVFPGYTGRYLDTNNFRIGAWKKVLAGLGIKYRKPYQTRHTFITLALENGLDAKDVAKLVGNSAETIYRHYAGAKRELTVPVF
jgi:integrase